MANPHSRTSVVFDLDGTLIDTAPDLWRATNHALASVGRPAITYEGLLSAVGQGGRKMVERGLAMTGGFDDALMEPAFEAFMTHYTAHIADHSKLLHGGQACLDGFQQRGVPMAVCTNKMESLAVTLLAALNLTDYFGAIIGGDTLSVRKPDPAPLEEARRRLGSAHAWMIGDSYNDIDAAKAAGWPSVAVTFGYGPGAANQLGADHIISDLSDLLSLSL